MNHLNAAGWGCLLATLAWGATWLSPRGTPLSLEQAFTNMPSLKAETIQKPVENGRGWNRGTVTFDSRGTFIKFLNLQNAPGVDVSLDSNDNYHLTFLSGGSRVAATNIRASWYPGGMYTYHVKVPAHAIEQGYDGLFLRPYGGDSSFSIGHVSVTTSVP